MMMIGTKKNLKKLTLDIILGKNSIDDSYFKLIYLHKDDMTYSLFCGLAFVKPTDPLQNKFNYYITFSLYNSTTVFEEIASHSKWFNNRRLIFTDIIKKYFIYKEYLKFASKYNFNYNEYSYSYYC